MWVGEEGEYFSLTFKAHFAHPADECDVKKFHGDLPLKSTVASLRQPHAAHSALPDLRHQPVVAKGLPGQCSPTRELDRPPLQELLLHQSTMLMEKRFQVIYEGGVLHTQSG